MIFGYKFIIIEIRGLCKTGNFFSVAEIFPDRPFCGRIIDVFPESVRKAGTDCGNEFGTGKGSGLRAGEKKEESVADKERTENKDYRVRVTKMIVRKEFTALLKEKPIQSITVRELCERTGDQPEYFYNHYRDVYDLLEQIENEMLAELAPA